MFETVKIMRIIDADIPVANAISHKWHRQCNSDNFSFLADTFSHLQAVHLTLSDDLCLIDGCEWADRTKQAPDSWVTH